MISATQWTALMAEIATALRRAGVEVADGENGFDPGTRAQVVSGVGQDPAGRLCALVWRSAATDQGETRDAAGHYAQVLRAAGYAVEPGWVPGGWQVWVVFPPAETLPRPADVELYHRALNTLPSPARSGLANCEWRNHEWWYWQDNPPAVYERAAVEMRKLAQQCLDAPAR